MMMIASRAAASRRAMATPRMHVAPMRKLRLSFAPPQCAMPSLEASLDVRRGMQPAAHSRSMCSVRSSTRSWRDAAVRTQAASPTITTRSFTMDGSASTSTAMSFSEMYDAADQASDALQGSESPSADDLIAAIQMWADLSQSMRTHAAKDSTTTILRGIPQRAEHLLSWWELTQQSSSLSPSKHRQAVNHIIRAWACSQEHLRGTMAEQTYRRLPEANTKRGGAAKDDALLLSYQWIVRAWCWSRERGSSNIAMNHFARMINKFRRNVKGTSNGSDAAATAGAGSAGSAADEQNSVSKSSKSRNSQTPTLEDYHVLFEAWTRADDKYAASKVIALVGIVEDAYKQGNTEIRLDKQCYRDALITMSRRPNASTQTGEAVDAILSTMKEQFFIPDSATYTAAIRTWMHVTKGEDCINPDAAAVRCFMLLQEMIQAHYRTTEDDITPTTANYNDVLEAFAAMPTKSNRIIERAMTLLETMEIAMDALENVEDFDDSHLFPDGKSYKLMLNFWKESRNESKLQEATQVLDRLKARAETLLSLSESNAEPIIEAFAAYVQICASADQSPKGASETRTAATAATQAMPTQERGNVNSTNSDGNRSNDNTATFKTAMLAVEDLRAMGLQPNSLIYSSLIQCCFHLLPDTRGRRLLLETIFQKCCQDGFVDQQVMKTMQDLAPALTYTSMIVAHCEIVEDMKVVPPSWTRNVQGFCVNTKNGRKVLPLTIDGKFTMTKAAAEFKMRRLRRQSNKRMLQGGRM